MSTGSFRTEVTDLCEAVLDKTSVDVDAYLESFPDERILRVPLEEIADIDGELVGDWRKRPDVVTGHMERAVARWLPDGESDEMAETVTEETDVRFTGYLEDELYEVGLYPPNDVLGKVIHVRGQVVKRSKRKLRDEVTAFECQRCGSITRIPQTGRELQEPHECSGCERQGPFREVERESEMRNYQNIRLQTLPEETEGTETSSLDVLLFDDHVGDLAPGDRVVVTLEMEGVRVSNSSRVKDLEAKCRSYVKLNEDYTDVDIEPHRERIEMIANGDHPEYDEPHDAIIPSVAPGHTGDDHIKEAIAYQIFSGVEKDLPDGTWMRGNSHIVLLGDPGTGKTTIIEYVSQLVPRSEYATGKNTTGAGLTATVQQNEFEDGSWTLEAGTLVKANNGLAAIDELDKMNPDDRDGMMEAMSQQRITVSMVKSGVLPAKCSVLAAANPKYGTFDPMQDIGSQLDLDPVLLSRFDLWFVMRDEVDEDADEEMARDVTTTARAGQKMKSDRLDEDDDDWDAPPISPEEFRAYVAMAKDCFPVFTDDAMDRIIAEYVELRQINDEDGPIPTTARVITALHRLSEASARMRLADEVTVEDVERAINILRTSLETLGIDPETGDMDASRFEAGMAKSKADRLAAVEGLIEGKQTAEEHADFEEVKEEALMLGMDEDEFEDALDKLKKRGDVYQPGGYDTLRCT